MIALILAAAAAGAAPAPALTDPFDVTGTWAVVAPFPAANGRAGSTATPVCTFQQAAGRLRGSCRGPIAIGTAIGAIEGRKLSWKWAAEFYTVANADTVGTFEATLGEDGKTLTGTMSLRGATAPMTAKKQ